MKTSVLRPGLLVSLKTSLRGGVAYQRVDIEGAHKVGEALVSRWETTKEIPDPVEFEAATKARSKARSVVAGVCAPSAFGLLCPQAKEEDLSKAIEGARFIAEAFNASARLSRVEVYVMVGRIAQDDVEAARAIASEGRELLDDMRSGIAAADVDKIRQAASQARALGSMLSEDVAGKVSAAVEQARKAAREIVKRVGTSGDREAARVETLGVSAIEAARFAFLDTDEAGQVEATAPESRGLDLLPADAAGGETRQTTTANNTLPLFGGLEV